MRNDEERKQTGPFHSRICPTVSVIHHNHSSVETNLRKNSNSQELTKVIGVSNEMILMRGNQVLVDWIKTRLTENYLNNQIACLHFAF